MILLLQLLLPAPRAGGGAPEARVDVEEEVFVVKTTSFPDLAPLLCRQRPASPQRHAVGAVVVVAAAAAAGGRPTCAGSAPRREKGAGRGGRAPGGTPGYLRGEKRPL